MELPGLRGLRLRRRRRHLPESSLTSPRRPKASAISLQRGMDNECVDGGFLVKDDSDYKAYRDAVKQGFLKESEIDTALVRLYHRAHAPRHV